MHSQSIQKWQHHHHFLGEKHVRNEWRTTLVVALTVVMMLAEIIGGNWYGSVAVVADGWHMSTHAAALGISVLAYRFARKHAHDARFTFGTGKVGELAGFASAIILAMVALGIGVQSVLRLRAPVQIVFDQAIFIAVVGLAVNLVSAWLLFDKNHHHRHDDAHGHDHEHRHDHQHGVAARHGDADSNLRSAYTHVLADAATSLLAIAALLAAKFYGMMWMDPAVGIVGAVLIASWSLSLIRSTSLVLLDEVPNQRLAGRLRKKLEVGGDRVADLHLWRLGPNHTGVIASIVTRDPRDPDFYRKRIAGIDGLSHVTIEVQRCD